MEMKVFWKKDCPNCPKAKKLAGEFEGNGARVRYLDIETVDGLTEATMINVKSTPSIIITDEKGNEKAGWRGQTPRKTEIETALH